METLSPRTDANTHNALRIRFLKTALLLVALLPTTGTTAQNSIQGPNCKGIIYGVVLGEDGGPARTIGVVLWPLGVELSYVLPRTRTNQAGEYRFQSLCPGRFTVLAEDEDAGYPISCPECNQFLYGTEQIAEVELFAAHSEAQFSFALPPRPGVLQVAAVNKETRGDVPSFGVRVKIPGQHKPNSMEFDFNERVQKRLLVPPDKDFELRVTAKGFHTWKESTRGARLARVAPGANTTLLVELQPK